MLTPQEVSTRAFAKAMMGGYNMAMVDEFLDELTEDYTALYKENAALKAKIKVLVERVEDYRSTEDSMRATLLTAQKMADSIVREAEEQREAILAQAEADAQERLTQLQEECSATQERLRRGQMELAQFISASRELFDRELRFLDRLPELELEEPAPPDSQTDAAVAASEIEEKVFATFSESPDQPETTGSAATAEEADASSTEAAGDPIDDEPTRRIHHLEPLRFGRNYGGSGDTPS